MLEIILIALFSYGLGSLSSAVIVCHLWRLPDPRTQGSKNPGATNVLRIGGKLPAAITLVGDFAKGVIAVSLAKLLVHSTLSINTACLAVFLGHLYPILFRFKGGKGVATAFGAFCALSPPLAGLLLITWGVVVLITKISALGAILASLFAPAYVFWLLGTDHLIVVSIMSLLLLFRHKENILRLWNKTESKIC
jgi:acyl phosphate:glycerol-3-phosphate acyltransferase